MAISKRTIIDNKQFFISLLVFIVIFITGTAYILSPKLLKPKRISASSSLTNNYGTHGPEKVFDGSFTEKKPDFWLLADNKPGWIQLDFDLEYTLSSLKLLNTKNSVYFNDHETDTCDILLGNSTNTEIIYKGKIPSFPTWATIDLTKSNIKSVKSIRINIDAVRNMGGGLNEIIIIGSRTDKVSAFNDILLCFFISSLLSLILYYLLTNSKPGFEKNKLLPLSGIFIGAIAYFSIIGLRLLNPFSYDWLMSNDPGMNFIGWLFFNNEPWHFPLGLIKNYNYPIGSSIILTDSIPFLALLGKIIRSFFGSVFQLYGIWILFCFIMQGLIAILLMRKIHSNFIFQIFGAALFVLSPIMLFRMQFHFALGAHWLILMGIYLYFSTWETKTLLLWLGLLLITILIHGYLFVMVFILWIGYIGKSYFIDLSISKINLVIYFIINLFTILVTTFLVGFFFIPQSGLAETGYGIYSFNILSLINPLDWSYFIKEQKFAFPQQYEGFNYIGAGGILLIVLLIIEFIKKKPEKQLLKQITPLLITGLILSLFAISTQVTFGEYELLHLKIPVFLGNIFSIFRASGRMFWPIYYLLLLLAIKSLATNNSSRVATTLIMLIFIIQFIDLKPKILSIKENFSNNEKWDNPMKSLFWSQVPMRYRSMVVLPLPYPYDMNTLNTFIPYAFFASSNKMTINVGRFARIDYSESQKVAERYRADAINGNYEKNALYIITDKALFESLTKNIKSPDVYATIDGFNIIAPGWKKFMTKL